MRNPTYSIIVPIYNSESTLHKCFDSILCQKNADFELLLIDDGSTDGSGKICDEYAAKDERITVIHKENGGVSSARNAGIDIMRGKWVTFVDSDDWIDDTFIPINTIDCDIIAQKWAFFGEVSEIENIDTTIDSEIIIQKHVEDGVLFEIHSIPTQKAFDGKYLKFMYDYLGSHLFRSPWGKFIRSEIIKKNSFSFNAKIRFGEDTIFMMNVVSVAKSVTVLNTGIYRYRFNDIFTRFNTSCEETLYFLHQYLNAYKLLPFQNKNNLRWIKYFFELILHINKEHKLRWKLNPTIAEIKAILKEDDTLEKRIRAKMVLILSRFLHIFNIV